MGVNTKLLAYVLNWTPQKNHAMIISIFVLFTPAASVKSVAYLSYFPGIIMFIRIPGTFHRCKHRNVAENVSPKWLLIL